jgi:chromosome segregation ATPase
MGKELEAFLAFANDPDAYKAKMQEFIDAEARANDAIAKAQADTAQATALLRQVNDQAEGLTARVFAFNEREAKAETSLTERMAKLDADTIKLNDRAQGLQRDEASLKARTETIQAREATATRLIADGTGRVEQAERTRKVFADAINAITMIMGEAKAKVGG